METLSLNDKAVLDTIFDPLHIEGTNTSWKENSGNAEETEELNKDVMALVKKAIECTEKQQWDDAFRHFDEAVDKMPYSPSILNDRAQALRLVSRDEDALNDLNLAIKLSNGCGKAGIRALCQRGLLYRRFGREDDAKQDFEKAAKGGSQFAKAQLVTLNPYAALCNAMLQKVFLPSTN